jgi:uncharacterized protein YwgA
VNRRDWLILLLGFKPKDKPAALDPIRIQKGMFLHAMRSGRPKKEKYTFRADNWGPYSRDLRRELEQLVAEGLVATKDVPGYRWKRYHLTAAGVEFARELIKEAPRDELHALIDIKEFVTERSFNKLLNEVYEEYPDYAVNSLFQA